MYVCLCYAISDARIREAVEAGAKDLRDVGRQTGAGTDCGRCRERIAELLAEPRDASDTQGGN